MYILPVFFSVYLIPCFLSFAFLPLRHVFPPLHSSSLGLVYCLECPEGCMFARGPKSSFLLEPGPCLWGWGGWWRWWARRRCFTQVLNTDRNGPFEGSHSKWGRSASAVQLAFRQPRSHSYSALSFQYRLPLLTSLIAFSQSPGYVFDESIKTLCIAKQAKPKSHQGSIALYLFCIMLHIHLSLCIISSSLWHTEVWIAYCE